MKILSIGSGIFKSKSQFQDEILFEKFKSEYDNPSHHGIETCQHCGTVVEFQPQDLELFWGIGRGIILWCPHCGHVILRYTENSYHLGSYSHDMPCPNYHLKKYQQLEELESSSKIYRLIDKIYGWIMRNFSSKTPY